MCDMDIPTCVFPSFPIPTNNASSQLAQDWVHGDLEKDSAVAARGAPLRGAPLWELGLDQQGHFEEEPLEDLWGSVKTVCPGVQFDPFLNSYNMYNM